MRSIRIVVALVAVLAIVPVGAATGAEDLEDLARSAAAGNIEASQELSRRAATGEPIAQYYEARFLLSAPDGRRREVEAADLLRKAALQGHVPSMHFLAVMLERGSADVRNLGEALEWHRAAA